MALFHSTRPAISTRHFPEYDTRHGLVPEKTCITTGHGTDFWVHGSLAGFDLRVFYGGCPVPLDPGVLTHEDAVQMCIRQFSPSRKAVRV